MTDAVVSLMDGWPVVVSARALYMERDAEATALDVMCPLCGEDAWFRGRPIHLMTLWACTCQQELTKMLLVLSPLDWERIVSTSLPTQDETVGMYWYWYKLGATQ